MVADRGGNTPLVPRSSLLIVSLTVIYGYHYSQSCSVATLESASDRFKQLEITSDLFRVIFTLFRGFSREFSKGGARIIDAREGLWGEKIFIQ